MKVFIVFALVAAAYGAPNSLLRPAEDIAADLTRPNIEEPFVNSHGPNFNNIGEDLTTISDSNNNPLVQIIINIVDNKQLETPVVPELVFPESPIPDDITRPIYRPETKPNFPEITGPEVKPNIPEISGPETKPNIEEPIMSLPAEIPETRPNVDGPFISLPMVIPGLARTADETPIVILPGDIDD